MINKQINGLTHMKRTAHPHRVVRLSVCLVDYRRWGNAISDFMLFTFHFSQVHVQKVWAMHVKRREKSIKT